MLLLTLITAQAAFAFQDTSGHWAARYIEEVRRINLLNGFPDGTFRPDANVTRDQFVTVAIRALHALGVIPNAVSNHPQYWAKNYIDKAKEIGLLETNEFGDEKPATFGKPILRSEIIPILARLVAVLKLPTNAELPSLKDWNTLQEPLRSEAEIVIRAGLMKGNSDGTLGVNKTMTRGQFATIIHRIVEARQEPKASMQAVLGSKFTPEPGSYKAMYRTNPSVRWYTYHDNFNNFNVVAVDNSDKVIAVVNQKQYALETLKATTLNPRVPELYILPNSYLVVFVDPHATRNLFFYEFIGNYDVFEQRPQNDEQRTAFEKMSEEIINAFRTREGVAPLLPSDVAREFGRSYSQEMATKRFFDHTTPDGRTFKDRVDAAKIAFSYVGENIAFNYLTPFELANGWIKSKGHRENLLNPAFTQAAIGIHVRDSDQWLYSTQLLYRPK